MRESGDRRDRREGVSIEKETACSNRLKAQQRCWSRQESAPETYA